MLADVAGSTAIAEQLGAERSKFLFDEVSRLITAQVHEYGGTVAQLTGDGALAVFGAPTAHDDDAERAVRAGLAVQQVVRRYAADVGEAYGVSLSVRLAVEVGSVVVDLDVSDDSERFNALGDPVNVAARLQEQADPGSLVLGPQAARAVTDVFELESLGEIGLRGRRAPVSVFKVCGAVGVQPPSRGKLIGRDFEVALLQRAVAELAEGLGVVIAVTGEPGIGKTRLVRDVVEEANGRITVLHGTGASYASGFPLWPLRDMLRRWLDMSVGASEAQVRLELKARLAELYGEPGERYVFLASVLGLSPELGEPDRVLGELSRENVQSRTVEVVGGLLASLAEQRPVLLVLDDLHWADAATLSLLEGLLEVTEAASLGVAMLYRSERDSGAWRLAERARARFPHRFREVELRALATDAATRVATETAGGELPANVAQLVVERAGGNPFFVQEAVRDLLEREVVVRNGDGLALRVDPEHIAVPIAIRSALQARLDRLGDEARQVISFASVIGRTFGTGLLGRVLGEEVVRTGLTELLRVELIVEERRRPSPEYRFRHGLVQEVAYASLLEADRRDAHRQVAEALAELSEANDMLPPAPLYAHHLAEADLAGPAADALIRAGDSARALGATDEAVTHYRQARKFLARLGDEDRSRETLFKIALGHHLAFDYPSAETAYDEAFSCRPDPPQPPVGDKVLRTAFLCPVEITPGYVNVHEASALTDLFYRGLLSVDRDLNVMPELAENFRVSSDGLTYLFQLREGLCWSDGHPLTMHDFAFTFAEMRRLAVPSVFLLDDVAEMTALDDHTLEISLHGARNYFPYLLTLPTARPWPRHIVERIGPDWRNEQPLVTNGPYRLVEHRVDRIVAEADPRWVGLRGNVGTIEITLQDSAEHVDCNPDDWGSGTYDVLVGAFPEMEASDTTLITEVPGLTVWILSLHGDSLMSADVRRAIAASIDGKRLKAVSRPAARPAQPAGLIPPAMPGYSRKSGVEYDPERAANLLEAAGFPEGKGLPVLRLGAQLGHREMADAVAEQLREAGIKVDVEVFESTLGSHDHLAAQRECDMAMRGWVADYPDPDGFFRGLLSHMDVPSAKRESVTRMLEEARQLRDRERRLALYQEIDRINVQELAVLVPLTYPRSTLLQRPWVSGVWANPISAVRLAEAVLEDPV